MHHELRNQNETKRILTGVWNLNGNKLINERHTDLGVPPVQPNEDVCVRDTSLLKLSEEL
jgi:hypothetical protein